MDESVKSKLLSSYDEGYKPQNYIPLIMDEMIAEKNKIVNMANPDYFYTVKDEYVRTLQDMYTEINKDNEKCKEMINQQAEIAILILAPLIVIFLLILVFIGSSK